MREWKIPKHELPERVGEVVVRGHSDWRCGQFYISWWDGKRFCGTPALEYNEWKGVDAWDYLD